MRSDELRVGQRWRDRDKRNLSGGRIVVVIALSDFFVYYNHPTVPRKTPYRSDRTRFLTAFRLEPDHAD